MIFRCFDCRKLKVWNEKKCYTIIMVNDTGEERKKRICQRCGDSISLVYEEGKKEAAYVIEE